MDASLPEMESEGLAWMSTWATSLLAEVCGPGPARVLDVGCGSGRLLRALKKNAPGLEAVGVDPYIPSRQEDGIRFHRLNAEAVSELLERFDLLLSSMSLHHFQSPSRFFRSAHRALRWHTGTLLLVDWKRGVETGIPEHYFRPREVVADLEASGWRVLIQRVKRWHFGILARPGRFRFAVAIEAQDRVPGGMLGTAPQFGVFEWDGREIRHVETRTNPYAHTRQHLKTLDVAHLLSDTSLLAAARIGPRGRQRLRDRGFRMLLTGGPAKLSQVLETVAAAFPVLRGELERDALAPLECQKQEVLPKSWLYE